MNYNFLLFILLTLLTFATTETIYKCADDLKLDTCRLDIRGDPDNTVYVKACKKGKKCSGSQCIKIFTLLDEGDKCTIDAECQTKKRPNGKCVYIADGAACEDNDNCGLNSSCENDVCTAMIAAGQACDSNINSCKKGLTCGTQGDETAKTCIKKYSVADGTKADSQSLCKGGDRDNGVCKAKTEDTTEWNAYVEAFTAELDDFLKKDTWLVEKKKPSSLCISK